MTVLRPRYKPCNLELVSIEDSASTSLHTLETVPTKRLLFLSGSSTVLWVWVRHHVMV